MPESTTTGPDTPAIRQVSVAARLNRLPITRFHRVATIVIGVGTFFDLFDIFLAGVLATVLTQEFGLTRLSLPAVIASSFLGMFVGSVALGSIADRFGRRRAFLWTLAIYSLATLAGAFSPNAAVLIASRFVAGLGLGAELPLVDTYLSELLPAADRGRYIVYAYTIGFFGVPGVGLLGRTLVAHHPLGWDGWRWLFVIGSLGSFAVWTLRRWLPESPRWLESVGRAAEADAVVRAIEQEAERQGPLPPVEAGEPVTTTPRSFEVLFRPEYRRRTIMLWIFQVFQAIGYYGFGTLVPLVLAAKGYSVINSLTYTALAYLGYPGGSALSLLVVERYERKWLIVGSAALMSAFGLGLSYSHSAVAIVAMGFAYTLVANIFSNALHIFQAEIFPTSVRATAAGTAYGLSRLSIAVMPFVLVPVLQQFGPGAMFAVVAAALWIVIVDIAVLAPNTTGRSLESVNEAGASQAGRPGVSG